MSRDNRFCLICKPRNRTIYFHKNDDGLVWLYCNKCARGYSLQQYCHISGITPEQLLSGDIHVEDSKPNEVQVLAWPSSFVPLSDPRAVKGVEYIKSRGLTLDGDMYYDLEEEGIVFPYYYGNHFCGAQIRFIKEKITKDGDPWKITTLPGTRLSLLLYGWNQEKMLPNVKAVVVTEGAFNALALNQAFVSAYGSVAASPWRFVACSGSGASEHHTKTLRELTEKGYKVVVAPDSDEAGLKMYHKFLDAKASTYYALTGEAADWNDKLKELGPRKLFKYFLDCIRPMNEQIGKR